VYFLIISTILFIGELSFNGKSLYKESIKAFSTIVTLGMMMVASGVTAGIDDFKRHKSDAQMNAQPAVKASGVDVVSITWDKVEVGDVLLIKSEEEIPADVVALACSGDEGCCYVSTANLDGETNLKVKCSASLTHVALCGEGESAEEEKGPLLNQAVRRLQQIGGSITAEAPTTSIHNFEGKLSLQGSNDVSLTAKNLLLRGTMLRNTSWCVGLVVYTGSDTRVVMNSRKAPLKVSNLERVINYSMLVILICQAAMALVSDIAFNMNHDRFKGYWYLFPRGVDDSILLPASIGYWITFFGLYSNLMPISLYATMEICNAVQSSFVRNDMRMYDEEFDCPAIVRSTNLAQELGQVEYIFSDKTGTLTQNVMELKRVAIAGQTFGKIGPVKGFQGGPQMQEASRESPAIMKTIEAFLEVLAVSHTVVVTHDQHGKLRYEAESPDEDALVSAAASLGWSFKGRVGQRIHVDVGMCQVQRQSYKVLALNAFTSARKRMSVLVQKESGEYELLVKGADNMMLERAAGSHSTLENQLTEFACEGLRTLVIGIRRLSPEEAQAWLQEYEEAQCALEDRNGALAKVAEKAEINLELLGATAIEDKLQVGVGETIMRMRRAGVKVWVLTGDKLETARNIGYSTKVLSDAMDIIVLDVNDALGSLEDQVHDGIRRVEKAAADGVIAGLMVTGFALENILGCDLQPLFLMMAQQCSVVVACRVSPLQKAEMVALVRNHVKPQPVTLAIGDGANDVPMIQEAQVGVGIVGREGRQAVNAADFAIAQFSFLQRLLLVHGRFNYLRTCKFTLYSFWRNNVCVLLMFYYTLVSGNSGISLFEEKVRMTFNFFLSGPILCPGIFDCDVPDDIVLHVPELYESGRKGQALNPRRMSESLLSAFAHSLVLWFVACAAYSGMQMHGAGDYYCFGTSLYTCLIVDGTYRVAFITRTWNRLSVAAIVLTLLLYVIFLVVYSYWKSLTPFMYQVPQHMIENAPFWVCVISCFLMVMSIDFVVGYLWLEFRPSRGDLILESATSNELEVATSEKMSEQLQRPQGSLQKRFSSFAFDHPEEDPRHHKDIRNPPNTAGDTSLVDVQVRSRHSSARSSQAATHSSARLSQEGTHSRAGSSRAATDTVSLEMVKMSSLQESGREDSSAALLRTPLDSQPMELPIRTNRPQDSPFFQQSLPSFQFVLTGKVVAMTTLAAGVVLVLLGVCTIISTQAVAQIYIKYDEDALANGTVERKACHMADDLEGKCSQFKMRVPQHMKQPILVEYVLDPFYQNFNSYVLSVVNGELSGQTGQSRKVCKQFPGTEAKDGKKIVPCGLRATSFFNDDFTIDGHSISTQGVAWQSDIDSFANPEDYNMRPHTSWLWMRYPSIDKDIGVKDARFVEWMRPAALPRVIKRYGVLEKDLEKGSIVDVQITSNFPTRGTFTKGLLLTTKTAMGDDVSFGHMLFIAGCICLLVPPFIGMVQLVSPRQPGKERTRAVPP